jgi:hypothetical protein
MNDVKLRTPRMPPGSGEKVTASSVSAGAALTPKSSRSRHAAITSDLYTYHRYKVWTAKIRNTFEEPK